jgi:hypothetical protein
MNNTTSVRVDDPCWNNQDRLLARNLYLHFKQAGYSNNESASYASAAIWKIKWPQTTYNAVVENALNSIHNSGST